MTDAQIAQVCHEANGAYCRATGDNSQPRWDDAPEWQKTSAVDGVSNMRKRNGVTPRESHENWLATKEKAGWVHGTTKNPSKKQHPCMVPYDQLPEEQKIKDCLFNAIASTLLGGAA